MSFSGDRISEHTRAVPLGRRLMDGAGVSAQGLADALGEATLTRTPLVETARRNGLAPAGRLLAAQAAAHGLPLLDLERGGPDERLASRLSSAFCLEHGVLPWGHFGPAVQIGICDPDRFATLRPDLEATFGPVVPALLDEADLHRFIAARHAARLAQEAETWVPDDESCRDINSWTPTSRRIGLALASLIAAGLIFLPQLFFLVALFTALGSLIVAQGTKLAAWLSTLRSEPPRKSRPLSRYPLVSVLVPVFREENIVQHLIDRLGRLAYPKSRLDVVLVLEAHDDTTRAAIRKRPLAPWMRVIEVPAGTVQTKPRAMNYALNFCRGEIIGIYDAEDAPAPDQIHKVVEAFERGPPQLACVQAILDFYNSKANWLSRCFAIEYAVWFRVMLRGYARLGFPIPLGGTSVFFRRSVLVQLCGWDAHNVTEDADLGLRLARHGYHTGLIASVTREEANNRPWPWVKQRSRWLKGYMITYLVHMRSPRRLWCDLGARGFYGVQALFLATLLQFLLAPLLWSFWLVALWNGPLWFDTWPNWSFGALTGLFLTSEGIAALIGVTAISLSPHRRLLPWIPTLALYYPLGVLAAYKALYELIAKPFYWDKTMHGHSTPDVSQPP